MAQLVRLARFRVSTCIDTRIDCNWQCANRIVVPHAAGKKAVRPGSTLSAQVLECSRRFAGKNNFILLLTT